MPYFLSPCIRSCLDFIISIKEKWNLTQLWYGCSVSIIAPKILDWFCSFSVMSLNLENSLSKIPSARTPFSRSADLIEFLYAYCHWEVSQWLWFYSIRLLKSNVSLNIIHVLVLFWLGFLFRHQSVDTTGLFSPNSI